VIAIKIDKFLKCRSYNMLGILDPSGMDHYEAIFDQYIQASDGF